MKKINQTAMEPCGAGAIFVPALRGFLCFFDPSQDRIPTGIYGTAFAPKAQMQPAKQAHLSSKF